MILTYSYYFMIVNLFKASWFIWKKNMYLKKKYLKKSCLSCFIHANDGHVFLALSFNVLVSLMTPR